MTEQPTEASQWLDAVRTDGRLQLRVPLNVYPWGFAFGGKQTLLLEVDGKPKAVVVTVPPGAQPGQVLRLRGVALGAERADVYVELQGTAVEPRVAIAVLAGLVTLAVTVVVFVLAQAGG